MVSKFYDKAKEKRIKREKEHNNESAWKIAIGLKGRNRHCEIKIVEVIKKIDSKENVKKYFQNKFGEKQSSMDAATQ